MSKSTISLIVDSGPKQGETLDRKPGSLIRIGRVVKGNTLAIKDPSISQKHLTIEFDPQISRWIIKDLGTANGTLINGDRIPSSSPLQLSDGDSIKLGESTSISVKISVGDESAEEAKRNGGRRGRSRPKKAENLEEILDLDGNEGNLRSSARVSQEAELLESEGLETGRKGSSLTSLKEDERLAPKNLERRRRTCQSRVSKKENIVESAVEDVNQAPKDLGKGKKRSYSRNSKKDVVVESAVEDVTEAPKELGKARKRSYSRESKKVDVVESAAEDETQAPKDLGKGRKKSDSRESKKDEILVLAVDVRNEARRTRASKKDGVVEPAVEAVTRVLKDLGMGRKRNYRRESKKDEILAVAVDDRDEAHHTGVSKKDDVVESVAEDVNQGPKDLGKGRKRGYSRVSKNDDVVKSAAEDVSQGPRDLGKGRKRGYSRVSKKDVILVAVDDGNKAPIKKLRTRNSSSNAVSNENETLDNAMEERTEALKNLVKVRGRKVTNVPKTLGRGGNSTTQVLEKNESLDTFTVDDRTAQLENLSRKERENSASMMIDDHLQPIVEISTEAPKNVGRGRRSNLPRVLKTDDIVDSVVENNTEVQKNLGRGRRTRSTVVPERDIISDLAVEDKIQVPKNMGRGKRKADSSVISKVDETLDLYVEDKQEAPKKLRRKMRTNSSNDAATDEIPDVVVENKIQVLKNVEGKKPKRAPSRRTRASSKALKEEQHLQPAHLSMTDPDLHLVGNAYQSKDLKEGSHQLEQSVNIQKMSLTSSTIAESKCKGSHNMHIFDKENKGSIKFQKAEAESMKMKNSSSERITLGEKSVSENIVTHLNAYEAIRVLPKTWNGNGIPNTTTKYKEDQKVTFHATPFEERLERALSDDRLFPQRNRTN